MINRCVSGEKIEFYYPDSKTADYLMKQTAYKGKTTQGGEALFYHIKDDAHWLEHEAINAITNVSVLFTDLLVEVKHEDDAARLIIKNYAKTPTIKWFDKMIKQWYYKELLNVWYKEKGLDVGREEITGMVSLLKTEIWKLYFQEI